MHNNHHYSVLMHADAEQTSYSETFSVSSFLNPRSYFNKSGATLFSRFVRYEIGKRQKRTNQRCHLKDLPQRIPQFPYFYGKEDGRADVERTCGDMQWVEKDDTSC